MAKLNSNYDKLAAGYLFPEIGRRVREFQASNPNTDVLRLGIGNTTEALPPAVVDGLHKRVDELSNIDTYSGYGNEQGEVALREALQALYAERNVKLDVDDFFVSDGAKPDSGNIQSIFCTDNVVAVQDPAYPVYVDTNVIAGRSKNFLTDKGVYDGLIYMPCTESNGFFAPPPEEKADLIYLCSPNNPTGTVASRDQLKQFVEYAKQHKSIIIFDAAYSAYISDPDLPVSIYEIEGAENCAIEINSFSKVAGFTGVRLGWAIVPKTLVVEDEEVGKVNRLWNRRQSTFFNGASNIVQAGGIAALSSEGRKECQALIDYYMENARIIREGLKKINITVFGGDNAPYIWLKTPGGQKSWDFFDKLLTETGVVGTPGSGFGPSGEGYFRLSAFGHKENVEKAVAKIQANLEL